jgi:hypothetical protein
MTMKGGATMPNAHWWLGAGAFVVAAVVGGCAAESIPAAEAQFWRGVSVNASEVDPPESLDELTADAATVVRGRIVDVVDVPPAVAGLPATDPVVALVVEVDEVLEGKPTGATVKVVRPREPAVSLEQIASTIPDGEALFFLEPAGYGDYFGTSSDLGILGEVDGVATTVLVPGLEANLVDPGSSLDDVEQSVVS